MIRGRIDMLDMVKKALRRRIRMCKEYLADIHRLEAQVSRMQAELVKLRQLEDVPYGTRIMCACGEADCYKALEYLPHGIVLYADASDREADFLIVDLPDNVFLDWRPQPGQRGVTFDTYADP
jgi:hypothetical protein